MGNHKLYHLFLFLFGVLYYWIFPLIILECGFISGMPGVDALDRYDYHLYVSEYLGIVFILCMSFFIGGLLPILFKEKKKQRIRKSTQIVSARDLAVCSIPFFIFTQLIIINARHILFRGYTVDYDIQTLGALATTNCIFLVLYLYSISMPLVKRWVRTYFLIVLIESSIMLLGLGSRMYVLIPIIAFIVSYIQTHKLSLRIFSIIVICILFFLCVGIWRMSNAGIDLKLLLYIGSAEPLLTWISAVSFFEYNDIELFAIPYNFCSSFLNFIPSFLFPEKKEYIYPLISDFDSPFGATNLLTSLLTDFGIIGSSILLFLTSFILTTIRYNWKSVFGSIYYCCVCGIIPFQLFRDNLPIINKVVVFNFLLIPIFIFIFIRGIYKIQQHRIIT